MPPCLAGSKGPECTKKKQIVKTPALCNKKTLDFAKQKMAHRNRGDGISEILEGNFVVGIFSYKHIRFSFIKIVL